MATRKKTTRKKATKRSAQKKKGGAGKKASAAGDADIVERIHATDEETIDRITGTAKRVHSSIMKGIKPDLSLPVRALSNVSYSASRGYLQIGRQKKVRTLSVNTVKSFAQTLRMMGLSKELVRNNDFA
ncbi:MAG: hypothetical protein V3R91_08555, partial [Myxococcota bacterium]